MPFEKGNKIGKGRKSKAEEEKANFFILNAIKEIKSLDNDDQAKTEIVKKLLESQRGQLFIAEHLFGKAPQFVETDVNFNNFSLKDVLNFDNS